MGKNQRKSGNLENRFLTQKEMSDVDKHNYVAVYLPHSYAISGWVIVTEEKTSNL
jgi:hypothetical protein